MDTENKSVEVVAEPKIESRFGFQRQNRVLSSKVIRFGTLGSAVALVGIFFIKSPDQPAPSSSHPEIRPPDSSQTTQNQQTVKFDPYSVSEEDRRIKDQNRKRGPKVVRLPGLQKIDRQTTAQIPPGSLVKAVLVTGASNGPVRAQLTEALQVNGETLIPEGATVVGTGQSSEERLIVKFTQLVLRDGSVSRISAQAADSADKTAGLKGSRVGQYATKYAAAIGLDFVGGMAAGLQDNQVVGPWGTTAPPTVKNALLNGTSRATIDMANDTLSSMRNKTPVIAVEAGKEIFVLFDGGQ